MDSTVTPLLAWSVRVSHALAFIETIAEATSGLQADMYKHAQRCAETDKTHSSPPLLLSSVDEVAVALMSSEASVKSDNITSKRGFKSSSTGVEHA